MEKIFNMTIQRALAEAKRGNVQAMLQVADFYSRKMNREDDHYADNLSLALKWYEKAAQTGDVYALEMTSSGYAIFAEASIQIGAYEDSLERMDTGLSICSAIDQLSGISSSKKASDA